MGPIGTVRQLYLPFGYSKGNVDMQLGFIKRVGGDKKLLTAELTVKHGKNQVTESVTLTWDDSLKGFVATSSGVKTLYRDSDTIKVVFSINKLNLNKAMTLIINKLINDEHPLKQEEEVDIDELNDIVDELILKVEGLKKKVKD